MLLALLAALTVSVAPAHADDILERDAQFQIPASPLANALIQFSTQSGVKVAAADEDVAQLTTKGLNGTFAAHTALSMLLEGTGLSFLPVGAGTVAIRGPGGFEERFNTIAHPIEFRNWIQRMQQGGVVAPR